MPSRSSTRRFDRVVMIDWSANSTPKRGRDSIWWAEGSPTTGPGAPANPSTRTEAIGSLIEVFEHHPDERILVGFDFSFGYPHGFAAALTGDRHAEWSAVWRWLADAVSDDHRNRNDRFEVAARLNAHLRATVGTAPFWGHPGATAIDDLARTKPESYAPFDEFRITEHRVRAAGHRPFSAWQLAYAGSVGSQILMGLRALEHLRRRPTLADRVRIWPFETGVGSESGRIVPGEILVAEIWPSMFPLDGSRHDVRDAAQVLTLVDRILDADGSGEIDGWFDPLLDDEERHRVLTQEGWTLGVR